MTASNVVFDTWAWWEVFGATPAGRRLARKYVENPRVRIHTSILGLAELSAKFLAEGQPSRTAGAFNHVESRGRVIPITRAVAEAAGPLRAHLRRTDRDASLVDALVLAAARDLGYVLVSADPAFARESDVVDH